MKKDIGFIGIGRMGSRMAANILKNRFPLWVYDVDRTATARLENSGANVAPSPADLGGHCNRIIFSLPDELIVDSVLFGDQGLKRSLEPGDILIDCGTSHPAYTRKTAAALKKEGIEFIDAPVSGTESRAEKGTLTIMVGGKADACAAVQPLLEALGTVIVFLGSAGQGQLSKMLNNVLYNISCAAMAEILPLAAKLGLDAEKICEVIRTGTGQSYGFDAFSGLVLDGIFDRGYAMNNAYKDMAAILELSTADRVPLPVTSAAMQTYQMALARGLGNENKGAMIKVWETMLGLKVRRPKNKGK
jgi:3-hydroxyisobutyrate dehydrogenase-like beta-hydroxyacid dehydrogenase